MIPTKEQQAQEYAENTINAFGNNGVPNGIKDIRQMIADGYVSGYTACEQSQWRSVEEELPEERDYVFAHVPQRILPAYCEVAYWDNEDWYTQDGELIRPDYWMRIPKLPSLPDTNTEKKC